MKAASDGEPTWSTELCPDWLISSLDNEDMRIRFLAFFVSPLDSIVEFLRNLCSLVRYYHFYSRAFRRTVPTVESHGCVQILERSSYVSLKRSRVESVCWNNILHHGHDDLQCMPWNPRGEQSSSGAKVLRVFILVKFIQYFHTLIVGFKWHRTSATR